MEISFTEFQNNYANHLIKLNNQNLQNIFYKFKYLFYNNVNEIDTTIIDTQNKSKIIVIDEYLERDNNKYFFVCFDYYFLIIKNDISFLSKHNDSDIYNLKQSPISQKGCKTDDEIFLYEISNFSKEFSFVEIDIKSFWSKIVNCICGYLIKKSYQNSIINHIEKPIKRTENQQERTDILYSNCIKLRNIGSGSGGHVELMYYIPEEKLFALKNPNCNEIELIERERQNYLDIYYPFITNYYGYIEKNGSKRLLIEYIDGKTLDKIDTKKLTENERYNIIFELILTIQYLHSKEYIYRDLHLQNIMIDQNNDAVLIDFDRLIKFNDQKTFDFNDAFIAPENEKTFKSDVYSLGCVIYYILFGEKLCINSQHEKEKEEEMKLIKLCLVNDQDKRLTLIKLIALFQEDFLSKMQTKGRREQKLISLLENNSIEANDKSELYYLIGMMYIRNDYIYRDVDKSIQYLSLSADQNNSDAQFSLGVIYYEGEYAPRDIYKSIQYLLQSASQNNSEAQFALGNIYYEGEYVTRDIDESIYYLSQSASQNNSDAQYKLGIIYYEGQYVKRDIDKSIQYLSQSARLHNSYAQFALGVIYYESQHVVRDIDLSIHYLSQSANQDNSDAQYALGIIYYENKYVKRDIDKAINYLSLAASHDNSYAQYKLGVIYYEGKYVKRDINESIHYLSLAAGLFNSDAQYKLGILYHEGKYVARDIVKSIQYLSLSANQNNSDAQFALGFIYENGFDVKIDIKKAIYLYSLASNHSQHNASFFLGSIYYEGRYIPYNIEKAIHYFKEASNLNNQYAKNNLGVIYKTGKGVNPNPAGSMVYFKEAIGQKNDAVAMFNLAHIYFYEEAGFANLDKAIEYLIKSSIKQVPHSIDLLCLAVIKKYGSSYSSCLVQNKFEKIDDGLGGLVFDEVSVTISTDELMDNRKYDKLYIFLKGINLVYYGCEIKNQIDMKKIEEVDNRPKINTLFYEAFGQELE